MNKAEQVYTAFEAELLALVWATKCFRCFLYGKQFRIFANFCGCQFPIDGWSLRVSEFDFIVEYKPGTKIKHVDSLSRHVAAIMEDAPSKENLANQRKDPFCNTRKPGTHSSKSEYFLDDSLT